MTNRIDHTGHTHPATPAGRAACRKANGHLAGTIFVSPVAVTPEIKMTGAVARRMARQAAEADNARTITTDAGRIRVGSIIIASVRGGGTETCTILEVSDNIKNDYAGWSAEGRWGYADQVVRIVRF